MSKGECKEENMKTTTLLIVLICVMMSGMAVAEGDQIYGTMDRNCSECAECTDVMDAMENLPFAQFDEKECGTRRNRTCLL
jgi:hypothetical protein